MMMMRVRSKVLTVRELRGLIQANALASSIDNIVIEEV